ncbi:YrdB family protein [Kitasatospora sp. NBC_01302]|uniref:YrdB family protein n=1 Tax=Kitasatospora sp. NBC_01302 TaxID=2903575 RepID=UPI002E0DB93D|nr:YrdB family protein [Kitasatospora sp. NBC_01302]
MQLPTPARAANETLAFLIELLALGSLAWWGCRTGPNLAVHLLLAMGAPLLAAVLWGRYAAPRAAVKLPLPGVLAVKALVFACGAAALAVVAGRPWGLAFALLALANTALATADRRSSEWIGKLDKRN